MLLFPIIFICAFICAQCVNESAFVEIDSNEYSTTNFGDVTIPPMFVLNLDRSKDRWTAAIQEMQRANLDVQRLSAVDGRALSKSQLEGYSNKLAIYLQPRGVLGCYLSHRKFWQLVVDNDYESAIVFEDDVKLIDNFRVNLQESLLSLRNLTDGYDVVLLGRIYDWMYLLNYLVIQLLSMILLTLIHLFLI